MQKGCGAEEETSIHVLCECAALASLRHAYLGTFFLDSEDVKEPKSRGYLELQQRNRAPLTRHQTVEYKGPI